MQQEFRGEVGLVVNGDLNQYGYKPALPADASVARACPQCRRLTWRYTQHCIHCSLDLAHWDWRQQQLMHRLSVRRNGKHLLAGGIALIGSSWFLDRLDIWPAAQVICFALGFLMLLRAGKLLER